MSNPETSIIIRTFNEERYLPGLLRAIQRQRYRDFEIINVDSGSYDRTTEIARQHGARVLPISSADFTFGYSLNVGIQAARGTFVVIVSAHTEPVDDLWLESLVAPLRQESTAMVYGRQYGTLSSKYGEVRDLARTFGPRRRALKPPHFFANNANSAILRDLWRHHPFDETLPGQEDIEWAKYWMERGYQVVYEPRAGIYHIHHETWRQVRRRYYREALATRAIGIWGRGSALPLALREGRYLASDLADALRNGQLLDRGREIFLFRLNKAFGTISGLLDGKVLASPAGRDALFFDRKCKAVVVRGRSQVALEEIDIPQVKPGDVLVEVAYASLTPADLALVGGERDGGQAQEQPFIPGTELSGWVARVGTNVGHVREGDPVVVQSPLGCGSCQPCRDSDFAGCAQPRLPGGCAEYLAVPGRAVYRLPRNTDMALATLCAPLAHVLKALRRLEQVYGHSGAPPRAAVMGAEATGYLCAQALALREWPVTVFDSEPRRLKPLHQAGIATSSDVDGFRQYDVVVETTGNVESLQRVSQTCKPGAIVLALAAPYPAQRASLLASIGRDGVLVCSAGAGAEDFQEAMQVLPQLWAGLLLETVFPLARSGEAWDALRRGERTRILVKVT